MRCAVGPVAMTRTLLFSFHDFLWAALYTARPTTAEDHFTSHRTFEPTSHQLKSVNGSSEVHTQQIETRKANPFAILFE
jgi:hypothetical protein